jgi:alkaline phosphatase D
VTLVVARDPELEDVVYERSLVAHPRHDGCVKHRVTGLSAGRHYWYRFVYSNDDGVASSNVGRTKTAPAATSNVPVRWAFFSCQDYVGRWYNSYVHLLEHYGPDEESDLDFLVFLGDYIYENTGDPSFQTPGAERGFVFADIAGAIRRGTATEPFYSAKSLANYRTLYKVYRSDRMLQRLHERFPMIAVWDDHEFSDDSHGATGTYFNGRRNELDAPRRRNAEQAFFEYMPCEVGLDAQGFLAIENGDLYPNTRIYDRFRFGANCEVFLTDLRTYRPDHLIPEDAFPGTVILDETMAGPAGVEPYVDFRSRAEPHATLNALVRPTYQAIVTGMLQQEDPERFANDPAAAGKLAGELTAGKQAARFINGVFEGAQLPPPIDLATQAILPRGLAYVTLGKQSIFDSVGSRYAVSHDLLPVVDAVTGYGLDDLLGAPQRAWLEAGVSGSGARWKIIGNSVSAVPMIFDFTNPAIPLPTGFPDSLRARLQLNADQWDGFPTAKREFLNAMSRTPNVVLMSGDIHSSWLGDHGDRRGLDPLATHRVFEFTGVAVSSSTVKRFIELQVNSLPQLQGVDTTGLIANLPSIFWLSSRSSPVNQPSVVEYVDLDSNGYVVLEASAGPLRGWFHHYPATEVTRNLYEDPAAVEALFTTTVYRVENDTVTEE